MATGKRVLNVGLKYSLDNRHTAVKPLSLPRSLHSRRIFPVATRRRSACNSRRNLSNDKRLSLELPSRRRDGEKVHYRSFVAATLEGPGRGFRSAVVAAPDD